MKTPQVGDKVQNIGLVFADPNGSGLFSLSSGEFEKVPAGTIGEIEDVETCFGFVEVITVVFFKGLGHVRARLGPSAWKFAGE